MKITVYEKRPYEEKIIQQFKDKYNIQIVSTDEILNEETLSLCKGSDGVTTLGYSKLDKNLLDKIKANGVKFLSTRTIGYNHYDLDYAKKIGFKVSNISYSPYGVADFTVMLMLISIRKYKPAMWRQNVNDYTLNGLMGKEMRNLTVGILGTGRIGAAVIKNLYGFGCNIIAYDKFQNEEIKKYAKYVDFEKLLELSDIISVHVPLNDENREIINKNSIAKMKNGVILINTARSELANISDLIEGIESEKIGALALDVFENEDEIYHHFFSLDIIKNRDMAYLRQFPNVVLTQHMAFFTDSAADEMITNGLKSLIDFYNTGTCQNEL
ncbi:MAG: D-isomer specific 2-hydroxyacid dehydrogenase family protein [Candidatus Gastranaerophilales bacterium]|nr:D-isomer specific 2-hydroxyacid dehydrogenase family protein [Candidatus Gastranaerophilales bacterium]